MSKDIFFVFIVYSANLFADVNYKNKRTPQRGFLLFYYARSPAGATGKTTIRLSIQNSIIQNHASYLKSTDAGATGKTTKVVNPAIPLYKSRIVS